MSDESPNPSAAAASSFKFDAKRWSQTDRIVAIATFVVFISLFLSWFGAFGVSVDGLYHGYMYLTLIVSLAILVYLALVAGMDKLPFKLPISHPQALLFGTAFNLLLTVISFLTKPSVTSWQFGAYIGLIAAIVAAAPRVIPAIQARFAK
jgi:hypothetical protein